MRSFPWVDGAQPRPSLAQSRCAEQGRGQLRALSAATSDESKVRPDGSSPSAGVSASPHRPLGCQSFIDVGYHGAPLHAPKMNFQTPSLKSFSKIHWLMSYLHVAS